MDEIAEFQWVANQKYRRVVAGHVPIAFFGIKLQREAARVAFRVRGPFLAADRGEADKRGSPFANRVKQFGGRIFRDFLAGADEISVLDRTFRVYLPLWNAFAIKMIHLFELL